MANDNIVYVGAKSPMNYVLAVITQFQNGAEKVDIKARGKAISKAVDVAEIVRNTFTKGDLKKEITTGTEELESKEGNKINVSTISVLIDNPGKLDEQKKEEKVEAPKEEKPTSNAPAKEEKVEAPKEEKPTSNAPAKEEKPKEE